MDDKFSFRDFTNTSVAVPNNITIHGSVFSHEKPDSKVFPDKMTGVVFVKCNLDNCFIPKGNKIVDCSQLRFQVQNDQNDWIVDKDNKPVTPIDADILAKRGVTVPKPESLSVCKLTERVYYGA